MKLISFILIFLLYSCAESKKEVKDDDLSSANNVVRIDTIEGRIFEGEASSEFQEIVIGPISNSNGEIVNSQDVFILESQDTNLLIGQINSASVASFQNSIEINADSNGFLKFKVSRPTSIGLYSIAIRAKTYESSTGLIYFQINSSSVADLGSVSSSAYVDTVPYNKIKDPNEDFGIINNQSTVITIGPVTDEFGNLVSNRRVDLAIVNGFMPSILQANGEVSSYAELEVINGFVNIGVSNISEDDPVRILATLAGIVDSEDDIQKIENGEIDVPYVDQNLDIVKSRIEISGDLDFGVSFIGSSKKKTINLQNFGNTPIENLKLIIEPPFEISGGSCQSITQLNPQESCLLEVSFRAQIRAFAISTLNIDGKFNGEDLPSIAIEAIAQGAFPANIKVELNGNLMEFENQAIGDLVTQAFTIINTGDVAATGLSLVNPPPHPGQIESFFTFRSPPESVPNADTTLGDHCGQEFRPQRRCKVYIDYLPRAKVGNEILGGTIDFNETDPVTIFVKGASFVNNFEREIPISSVQYEIKKDEVETVQVVVGPIRDIFGENVQNQNIQIQVFREVEKENGDILREYVGDISSPNIVIGGPPNTTVIRTDSEGFANFQLKSQKSDSVGNFIVEAKIIDNEDNVLSTGQREYTFTGTKLIFDEESYNFAESVINREYTRRIFLTNEGTLDARNISIDFDTEFFYVKDELTCVGISEGLLNLNIGELCSFEIGVVTQDKINYFDTMKILSSTFGTKQEATVFAKGVNPATLSSQTSIIIETHITGSDPLVKKIGVTNIGDETAINLQAYTLDENNSFQYSFACSSIEAGRSCELEVTYDPITIPNKILNTELVIVGIGEDSLFGTEFRIPVEINHSSLQFTSLDPGININRCYPLKVKGFDTDDNDLNFSEDILLNLRVDNGTGDFYIDPNCASSPITSVLMPANTFLSDQFYYKPTSSGVQILIAESSEISSAKKSFQIYKEPTSLKIRLGNAQNVLTERILPENLVTQILDEDSNGIPNISLNAQIMEDISQKSQLISNSTFSSNLNSWEIIQGSIEWFRGFGGSVQMNAIDEVPIMRSSPIVLTIGNKYNLSLKIAELAGIPQAGQIIIQVEDTLNGNIYDEYLIENKSTRIFSHIAQSESVRLIVKTAGISTGTRTFVDNIFFTSELQEASVNSSIYGSLLGNQPYISDFTGPGNVSVGFQSGNIPSLIIVKFDSDEPSLSNKEVLFSINVEIPTNILGSLGSLIIDQENGLSLVKNGGDNLAQLEELEGYNWDENSKTLTLRAGQKYDFENITISQGATLNFEPDFTNREPMLTELYSKQNCAINGLINLKGFVKDVAEEKDYEFEGVDGESILAFLPEYLNSGSGGSGGGGGYRHLERSRSCRQVCGKSCSFSCEANYSSWQYTTPYIEVLEGNNLSNATPFKGGDGANGQPGRYPGDARFNTFPPQTFGGIGGQKGKDGGFLFLHCFNSISGNGYLDLSGSDGDFGGNGAFGDYQNTSPWCISTVSNGECNVQRYRRQVSGGSGGGAAGNGGHGGTLFIKTKAPNYSFTIDISGGDGGNGGDAGPSFFGTNNGGAGSSGVGGDAGQCKEIDADNNVSACL